VCPIQRRRRRRRSQLWFWTYEQCRATVSGIGGYCEVNAMYRGTQPGMIPPPPGLPRRYGY
jgi:Protein of unknown function (DUF3551)